MTNTVEFYRLSRKFVDRQQAPPQSEHLIQYALAVGHHIGVLDCFSRVLALSRNEYSGWLSRIPPGEGRNKLEGVLKWGEIEINSHHVSGLANALSDDLSGMQPQEQEWTHQLLALLQIIDQDPIIYLLVRSASN
jgi:formate hydrogenlyase maturation protein HycH